MLFVCVCMFFFVFKQKTAYERRISDWSSDVCSSDLFVGDRRIDSMKELLAQDFDAVFVGSGAPRGRDLDLPGRREGAANIHVGLDWLANVYFGHVTKVGKRVLVLGGGNTAMDCCRS